MGMQIRLINKLNLIQSPFLLTLLPLRVRVSRLKTQDDQQDLDPEYPVIPSKKNSGRFHHKILRRTFFKGLLGVYA